MEILIPGSLYPGTICMCSRASARTESKSGGQAAVKFLLPCHLEWLYFDLFIYIRILGQMSFEEKKKTSIAEEKKKPVFSFLQLS